ncbi:MAG: hypothetical protein KC766_09615 [Myxococcales bacterium]|nr:hypothetical protein [Myxococcales bacterium]
MENQGGNEPTQFHDRFERWAGKVRRRMLFSRALTGLAYGLLGGVVVAGGAWWLRQSVLRPWAAALGLVGVVGAVAWATRKRWSDRDVALFLDARLTSDEVISTAVELRSEAERNDPARELVVKQAARKLASSDPRLARPRLLMKRHGIAPLAALAILYFNFIQLPPAPPSPPPPPGAELVQVDELKGLEKIIQLEKLDARDAEQRKRLDAIAKEARKLREDLKNGLEKREALARIAKLRDEIAAEKMAHGDAKNRAGLEAALNKLKQNQKTEGAAKALGEGDLTQFDKEMQKLANQAEQADRDAAKKALEEAAKAAREKGAEDVAKSLEEQKKLFEERSKGAEALRELGKQLGDKLPPGAQKDLQEFGDTGDPAARKRLADALGEALEGMTDAERKQLAENLGKQLEQQGGGAMSPEQMKDLAESLKDPEARKKLAEALKELGQPPGSGDAQREQGLDDAERGGGEAQKGLGAPAPVPGGNPGAGNEPGSKPGAGSGKQPGAGKGAGKNPGKGKGKGGPGSDHDEGEGDHEGSTDRVEGGDLRSKAGTKWNKGGGLHGATLGRSSSSGAGETANQKGSGALGKVAPQEIGGVERSEVPEEYREQVGRYFEP